MKTYFQTKFILINYPPKMLIKWWKWSPRISRKFIWRGLTIDIKTSVFSGSSFMPTFVTFNFETDGKSSFNQRYFYFYEKTLEKEYSIQSGNYVLNFYISSEMLLLKELPINTSIQETINHSNTIVLVEPKKVEKTPILKVQNPDDVILFEYAEMPSVMQLIKQHHLLVKDPIFENDCLLITNLPLRISGFLKEELAKIENLTFEILGIY